MSHSSPNAPSSELFLDPLLPRGSACLPCRRRKMRCDAAKPVCTRCIRGGLEEDCEYVSRQGISRNQVLEDNIAALEARIHELQNPGAATNSIVLHNPHTEMPQLCRTSEGDSHCGMSLTVEQIFTLIDAFLQHAPRVGFFMNAHRFTRTVQRSLPLTDCQPLLGVLVSTACLWGSRFSSAAAQQLQDQLLADAVRQITYSLVITDTDTPTHDIIAFIQAEVLLANYFFTHDRVLEGKYHSSAALSLALSCKLNLRPSSQYQNSGSRTLLSGLPPPEDHIQLGERVNAFWTVHSLYQTWAVVLDSAASLWAGEGSFGARVEIPWPLSMDTCEKGQLSAADMEDRNIVMRFLNREDRPELISLPPLALYCRAAILFANASRLASKYNSNMFHQDRATFSEQFQCLHACITMFLKEITTLELIRPLPAFLVISVLTRVALIRLHEHRSMDNHSRETCLAAANGILTLLQRVKKNDFTYIDPIVAVLLYSTGDVYVTETARYKGSLKNNIGAEDRTYTGSLAASAEQLLIVMEELEPICPLLASRRRQFVVAVSSM